MTDKKFDWADYYRELYLKEKLNTDSLLLPLKQAEDQRDSLGKELAKIENNFFWKCLKPVRVILNIAGGRTNISAKLLELLGSSAFDDQRQKQYTKELYLQSHNDEAFKEEQEKQIEGLLKENKENFCPLSKADTLLLCWNGKEAIKDQLKNKDQYKYVIFTKEETKFFDNFWPVCGYYIKKYKDKALFYWDEVNNLKPPVCGVETLLSYFVFGSGILVDKKYVDKYINSICEEGFNFVYELCLLILEEELELDKKLIKHIPYILCDGLEAKEEMPGSGEEAQKVRQRAIERLSWTGRYNKGSFTYGQDLKTLTFIPDIKEDTTVSAVILSKDHPEVLHRLLKSIFERTNFDLDKLEIIVVDNGSCKENKTIYQDLSARYGYRYVYRPMDFNFSAMCNIGAGFAKGDCLLLLNDDIEVIHGDWLKLLAGMCLIKGVGACGAKLLYAGTNQIQHAGVTNLAVGPSHKLVTFEDNVTYYHGANILTLNMLAVTAACLMVERKKYVDLGGLDEDFKVAYNDVEFCFRLASKGYRNVQCNNALLYHYESLSRGLDEDSDEKWDRLLREKEKLYSLYPQYCGKDPYYNEGLVGNAPDYRVCYQFPYEDHLYTHELVEETRKSMKIPKRTNENILKLTVDHARVQRKIHNSEDFICHIDGWAYLVNKDNFAYDRVICIKDTNSDKIYSVVPDKWYRKDVCEILPKEKNIGLSGFSVRFKRSDLPKGEYRIGMLLKKPKEKYFAWSGSILKID